MIELLQIILILSVIRFTFRTIFFERKIILLFTTIFIFASSLLLYPIILKQSGNFYTKALESRIFVQDISIIITIDAIFGIILSILLLRIFFKQSSNKLRNWFLFIPDLLIIGFIAYSEQQIFYTFTGYNFFYTTLILASVITFIIIILNIIITKLLPDKAVKYEFNFIINILILIIAIFLNSYSGSYNIVDYKSNIEWQSTLAFFALVLFGFILGLVFKKRK